MKLLKQVVTGLVLAAGLASTGASAQVIEEYAYLPDKVYPIRTGLGLTTQVELSPNEEVLDYSTGYSGGWDISRRGNVFYLKPKNVDVDTNLLIRTAAHSYILELRVVTSDWRVLDQAKAAGVQYRVRFSYPSDTSFGATTKEPAAVASELDTEVKSNRAYHFSYDYTYKRRQPSWLIPASVYDDYRFTYIKLGDRTRFPSGNFPAVFARESEHGEEFVVNSTVEGDTIVVHGTYPYLVIRHGNNVLGLRRSR